MSESAVLALPPVGEAAALEQLLPDFAFVTEEGAELRPQRAFQQRCEDIAWELAMSSPTQRAAAYASRTYSSRELSTAAALRPEVMPVLNGEWEWIALTLVDSEDG